MHEGGFFYQALVYLAAAVIAVPISKKLGLGSVLGYLIAGICIGPFALGFIGKEGQDIMHFAEFGVVMMLFIIGLELAPSMIWRMRKSILGTGGIQVGLTTVALMLLGIYFDLSWQAALAIGMTLSLSSTAIVLQSLSEKGLMGTEGGKTSFAILLFQDIAFIPILAMLPLLAIGQPAHDAAAGHSTDLIAGLPLWAQTTTVLLVVASIVLAGKYLISPCFRFIAKARLREIFTAAVLLLVIAIAVTMTMVGLSPALGTFIAGVALAQSEYRHELETDIEPFKGLLLGLFFIAVGASIDFNLIFENPAMILGLVALLIFVKLVILTAVGRFSGLCLDNSLLVAFSLAQGGEFGFVLFAFMTQNQILPNDVANPLIAVVALTMALTPILMLINEKLLQPNIGTRVAEKREADTIDHHHDVIIAGFGRVGSTIGRFLESNGISATYLDLDPDNVELLRKMGLEVFYGDASRYDLLHAAGAAEAKILIVAVDLPEKTREIVVTAKKHFPQLKIIVRSRSWNDSYELIDLGIKDIYRETLDSALRMGADTLAELGFRKHQTYRATKIFRKHDEQYLRELATMRHDEKALISGAKQRIADLEKRIRDERESLYQDRDTGWDADTLREEFAPLQKDPD